MVFQERAVSGRMCATLFALGLVVTLGLAAYFFMVRWYPRVGVDGTVQFSLPYALTCLQPWLFFECKSSFLTLADVSDRRFYNIISMTYAPALMGLIPAGFAIWSKHFDYSRKRVVSGYPVMDVREATDALAMERKDGSDGINWLPDLRLSREREKLGLLVTGAPGGGKTMAIIPIVFNAQRRGDRLIIIDTKGDFTASCLNDRVDGREVPPIILAPHDQRSAFWHVAEDILLPEDAIELATLLIPDVKGQNQFFPEAARAILVVSILRLVALRPGEWSWAELVELSRRPTDELLADAQLLYEDAVPYLTGEGSDARVGTTGTVSQAMQNVRILASVWNDEAMADPNVEKFSLKRFLTDVDRYAGRTVILQRSGRFSNLTDRWMTAFLTMAGTLVGTAEMRENDTSPIWFVVDEFGELPRVQKFQKLVNQGRSKGVRVVVAAQDVAQIKDVYGGNLLESYQTMFTTRVVGRMNPGEPATKLSTDLGEVVQKWQRRVPNGHDGYRLEDKESRLPAVHAGDLSNELRVNRRKKYCEMFLVGVAPGPVKVRVPIVLPKQLREPVEPAEWTKVPFELQGTELEWLKASDAARAKAKEKRDRDRNAAKPVPDKGVPLKEERVEPAVPLNKLQSAARPRLQYVGEVTDADMSTDRSNPATPTDGGPTAKLAADGQLGTDERRCPKDDPEPDDREGPQMGFRFGPKMIG